MTIAVSYFAETMKTGRFRSGEPCYTGRTVCGFPMGVARITPLFHLTVVLLNSSMIFNCFHLVLAAHVCAIEQLTRLQSGVLITYSSESTPCVSDGKSPAQLLSAWPSAMAGPMVKLVVLGERKAGVGSLLLNFVADEEELPRNFSTRRFSVAPGANASLLLSLSFFGFTVSCRVAFVLVGSFPLSWLALYLPHLRTYRSTLAPIRPQSLLRLATTSSTPPLPPPTSLAHVSLFHSLSPLLSPSLADGDRSARDTQKSS